MADTNVKNAQIYLNSMYGHRSDWVHLDEDGITGTNTITGIIRAFQIENGLEVDGAVGPACLSRFKSLAPISKMNPNDPTSANVCIVQCALFCKGYAAGGITGIYYTSGVNAVRQLQEDANIGVTGVINWKVWSALLSYNWFTAPANPTSDYDPIIRDIQRQLNGDYSDYINVRACDGIMSRETALSVLGALQAAEGILSPNDTLTNLNNLNFGTQTTTLFPGPLKDNTHKDFNKLAQYGLYFNGYNPGNFDGNYDSNMWYAVNNFQEFYALRSKIDEDLGTIGVSTMKSLLTSRGDTDRAADACDCSTILNDQQIADLKDAGYLTVGRYLTGTVGVGANERAKNLTPAEISRITTAGLRIFPIYQDGGTNIDYFKNAERGSSDAYTAIDAAKRLGFPAGSTIYFAVDFDCLPDETDAYIVPYFNNINGVFNLTYNDQMYKVGVYGPRQLCTELQNRMLSTSSFVSDMSSGFTGNCGYPLPLNWAFDQFWEITSFSSSPSFAVDKVALSNDASKDKGAFTFNQADPYGDDVRINAVYKKYFNKFMMASVPVQNAYSYDIDFLNAKVPVGKMYTALGEIDFYVESKTTYSVDPDGSIININMENGELTPDFGESLDSILSALDWSLFGEEAEKCYNAVVKHTYDIASEMKKGKLVFSFKFLPNNIEVSIAWECDTLNIPADGEGGQAYTLSLHLGWIMDIITYPPEYVAAGEKIEKVTLAAAAVALWAYCFPVLLESVASLNLGTLSDLGSGITDAVIKILEALGILAKS